MSEKVTTASETIRKESESTSSDVSSGSSRQSKSQMDAMNREELLLHAKKQLILLQKVKSRCDEIGSKNTTLEANLRSKESEFVEIKTKYEANVKENNEIRERFSIVDSQNTSLTRKILELEEQLECTQMKQKTAEATFSCLSDDMTKLQTENKELRNEVSVLKTAREDAVLSLKTLKETLNEKHALEMAEASQKMQFENEQLESVVRSLRDELLMCKQHINAIEADKVAALEEIASQNAVLEQLRNESESRLIDCEAILSEAKEMKAQNDSLKVEMSVLRELCERQQQELAEFASQDELLRVERLDFVNLKAEFEHLKSKDAETEIGLEELRVECEQLRKEKSDFQVANEALKGSKDSMIAEIQEFKSRLETSEQSEKLCKIEYETRRVEFETQEAKYLHMKDDVEVTIRENENLRQQLSNCGSTEQTEHKEALDRLQNDYDTMKNDYKELLLRYESEIRELQSRLETSDETKKLCEMDYETMKAEFEKQEAKFRLTKDEIEITIQENENLQQQLSECGSTEQTEHKKEALVCLQNDYDTLKNDYKELLLKYEDLAQEKDEIFEEFANMKDRFLALQEEVEDSKYKEALLEAEQSAVQLLQRECDGLRLQLDEQRSKESFLEAERDALLSSLQHESDVKKLEDIETDRSLRDECDNLRQEIDVLRSRESVLEAEKNVLMSSLQECDLLKHELEEMRNKSDLMMNDRLQSVTQLNEELEKQLQLIQQQALRLESTLYGCRDTFMTNEPNVADILSDCIEEIANWKEKEQNEMKKMFDIVVKVESENVKLEDTIKLLTETLSSLNVKVTALEDAGAITVQTVAAACQTNVKGTTYDVELRDVSIDCDIGAEKPQDIVERQPKKCLECERVESLFQGKLNQFTSSIRMMRTEIVSIASTLKDASKLLKDCEYEDNSLMETIEDLEKHILDADKTKDEDVDGGNTTIGDLQKLSNVISLLPDVLRKKHASLNSVPISVSKEKSFDSKGAEEMLNKYKIIAVKAKKESAEIKKKLDVMNSELLASIKEKNALEESVRSVGSQLNEERQKHKTTMSKLEQHSNLISLEIADYERHASDLSKQLAEKEAVVNALEKDVAAQVDKIHGLQVQIGQLETQYQQSEERGEQLKSVSVKLRKDIADLQKDETELKVREATLLAQLESTSQEVENYKVQLSDVSVANQKLQLTNHSIQEAHQKVVRLLETKISSLNEEVSKIRSEYEGCLSEYESYKVRVHSVLKQQKSKSPTETQSSLDMSIEEKVHLEKAIETLQTRIQELSARHAAVETENETLQEEHFNLLQRHNKMAANLAEQESSWRQRLEKLQSELKLEQQERSDLMRHIQLQDETHEFALKKKIDALQEVHQMEVERLQEQLGVIEAQNLKLQREIAQGEMTRNSYRDDEQVVDIFNMERQEGEGSEFTESQKLGLSSSMITSFMPLEQLLGQDERTSVSSINTIETEKLEGQLVISTKKIEHLTEILHESEATNARMTEQNRVLKEEIRRLERNQEREKHLANMEYLKNVIVKFISLSAGDEREHLVPVLTTLLRLSPLEEQQITTIARGAVETSSNAVGGWSSYLPMPRWPGTF